MTSAEMVDLLRRIAPDLGSTPIYLGLSSEGLPSELVPAGAGGYTGQRVDLALRGWLGDRWQGRGPALVLDDLGLKRDTGELMGGFPNDLYGGWLVAILAHEAAHVLARPLDVGEVDEPEVEAVAAYTAAWCAGPVRSLPVQWFGHDGPFIRTLLHVVHRARQLGYPAPLSVAFNGGSFGLSHVERYRAALGDEPARLHSLTFAEIKATRPPREFVSLWREDVCSWLSDLSYVDTTTSVLAAEALRCFSRLKGSDA